MISTLLRRLGLTSVLMGALIGSGVWLGEPAIGTEYAAIVDESKKNVVEQVEDLGAMRSRAPAAGSVEIEAAVPSAARRPAALRWPYFSFGRKRSAASW